MTFGAPQASQLSNGINFNYVQQPVTLTIVNAPRTSATNSAVTYSVEVATNTSFSNPLFTRADIAESAGGTTSVTLGTLNGDAAVLLALARDGGLGIAAGRRRRRPS